MHFVSIRELGGHGMGLMMWRREEVEYLVRFSRFKWGRKVERSMFDLLTEGVIIRGEFYLWWAEV